MEKLELPDQEKIIKKLMDEGKKYQLPPLRKLERRL